MARNWLCCLPQSIFGSTSRVGIFFSGVLITLLALYLKSILFGRFTSQTPPLANEDKISSSKPTNEEKPNDSFFPGILAKIVGPAPTTTSTSTTTTTTTPLNPIPERLFPSSCRWSQLVKIKERPLHLSFLSKSDFQQVRDSWQLMNCPASYNCSNIRNMGQGDGEGPGGQGPYRLCFDQYFQLVPQNCTVYSFGIANDWAFDDEACRFGCDVFSFDPTINLQRHKRPQGEEFFPYGLSNADHKSGQGWDMKALESVHKELGHDKNNTVIDILKIDIEGDEVKSLAHLIENGFLSKYVKTILVEWHPGWGSSRDPQECITVFYNLRMVAGFETFFAEPRMREGYFFNVESYVNTRFARS